MLAMSEGLRFAQFGVALRDHMLHLTKPSIDRNLAVSAQSPCWFWVRASLSSRYDAPEL